MKLCPREESLDVDSLRALFEDKLKDKRPSVVSEIAVEDVIKLEKLKKKWGIEAVQI